MQDLLLMLSSEVMAKPLWMWLVFFAVVLFLLVLDLGVFNRKDHEIEVKESLKMSAFYITIGLLFGGWVWYSLGETKGIEYLTGFVIEKTLAMDNIFVIAMIFGYFHVPRKYQHRVLFWGILGVIFLRGIMIGLGAALVHEFEWILYFFAAFLIFTGIKMLVSAEEEPDIGENTVLKFLQRNFRTTKKLHGHDFFARDEDPKTGKTVWAMTPLFVTLVMIEIADVIFAVDSVPAIFAITTDPYIVYTSNIFAILGLRALYFALAAMINRFEYLKYALSVVLIFIGSKIFVADMLDIMKIPPLLSLAITVAILVAGVIFSLWKTGRKSAVEK
ncbi:MAG: TerC family protein [Alphaproteobacteria bacterium]|nr:TerC family protein [Alphaproteobacteria bacterium]